MSRILFVGFASTAAALLAIATAGRGSTAADDSDTRASADTSQLAGMIDERRGGIQSELLQDLNGQMAALRQQ
jgi:hypothetical protein